MSSPSLSSLIKTAVGGVFFIDQLERRGGEG